MTKGEKIKVALIVFTAPEAEIRGAALQKLADQNGLLDIVVANMEQEPEDVIATLEGAAVLITVNKEFTSRIATRLPGLKLLQTFSAGTDQIDKTQLLSQGTKVANNGGANAVAVAEHAVWLMVSINHKLDLQIESVKAGEWMKGVTGALSEYTSLVDMQVGIIGLGRIGSRVAKRLAGWECNVVYHDPITFDAEYEADTGATRMALDELIATSDIISLPVPLDMKTDAGMDLARKLIIDSDVLIESFAHGVITRMGLGYEDLRKLNPSLIMVSTCLMGQTGPAACLAGFGYHAASLAGFYEVTDWPDLAPAAPWIAYTDTIAPRFVSTMLAAALDHRRRTGEGCYIDIAQIETALHFLAPEFLDLQVNGHAATRMGNRNRFCAPQGVYQCSGDNEWCAIGIDTDDQWQSLCTVIEQPDWGSDPAYATHAARHQRHDNIDEAITRWTCERNKFDAMAILQSARIPTGAVQNSGNLLEDAQYKHREFYQYFNHTEMGNTPYAGHQYRISDYDNGPRGPAPCLGEHSFDVLSQMMALTDEEIAEAYASGAIA